MEFIPEVNYLDLQLGRNFHSHCATVVSTSLVLLMVIIHTGPEYYFSSMSVFFRKQLFEWFFYGSETHFLKIDSPPNSTYV